MFQVFSLPFPEGTTTDSPTLANKQSDRGLSNSSQHFHHLIHFCIPYTHRLLHSSIFAKSMHTCKVRHMSWLTWGSWACSSRAVFPGCAAFSTSKYWCGRTCYFSLIKIKGMFIRRLSSQYFEANTIFPFIRLWEITCSSPLFVNTRTVDQTLLPRLYSLTWVPCLVYGKTTMYKVLGLW